MRCGDGQEVVGACLRPALYSAAPARRSAKPRTRVSAPSGDDRLGCNGPPRWRAYWDGRVSPMLERGSPRAVAIGRWGASLSLVIAAMLIGRLIRAYPFLLPNRLPGLALYELGPGLILASATGAAITITRGSGSLGGLARLALFGLAALVTGAIVLAVEFNDALRGQWI